MLGMVDCDVHCMNEKANYLGDRSIVDYGLLAHLRPEGISGMRAMWGAGISGFKLLRARPMALTNLPPWLARYSTARTTELDGQATGAPWALRLRHLRRRPLSIAAPQIGEGARDPLGYSQIVMARVPAACR